MGRTTRSKAISPKKRKTRKDGTKMTVKVKKADPKKQSVAVENDNEIEQETAYERLLRKVDENKCKAIDQTEVEKETVGKRQKSSRAMGAVNSPSERVNFYDDVILTHSIWNTIGVFINTQNCQFWYQRLHYMKQKIQ